MSLVPESIEFNFPHLPTTLLMTGIAWALLALFSFLAMRKRGMVPHALQSVFELTSGVVFDLADEAIGPEAPNYYPLFLGIFLFILFGNLLGLIPGLVSPTSSLNTTAALALVVFVYYNAQGFRKHGLGYFKHFMGPKLPWYLFPINMLIFLIEIIGHFARPLSLAIRLFGNIFAKEVLLGILAFLAIVFLGLHNPLLKYSLSAGPLLLRPAIILLGLLVGLIQAFVFLILSVIYVAGAVAAAEH